MGSFLLKYTSSGVGYSLQENNKERPFTLHVAVVTGFTDLTLGQIKKQVHVVIIASTL